jgi:Rod binding domain-containing protein
MMVPPPSLAAIPAAQPRSAQTKEAAAGFEALFLAQVLASMRASVPGSGLLEDHGDAWRSMLDQHLAVELARRAPIGVLNQIGAAK